MRARAPFAKDVLVSFGPVDVDCPMKPLPLCGCRHENYENSVLD